MEEQKDGKRYRHNRARYYCQVEGCTKLSQGGRKCTKHGGGLRCNVDGCTKSSQRGGKCRADGSKNVAFKKNLASRTKALRIVNNAIFIPIHLRRLRY